MMVEDLEPKKVFSFFKEISSIPRESYHEKAISDYLVNFAKERNLEVFQDEKLNVIIRKNATIGYENSIPVIIQGHMDMVCEKTNDSNHDFRKDPIEFKIKDGCLYANNTTLGADDGIAVAYALAILDSDDIAHPALEVVVTTSEETGMDGAMALDTARLTGKRLINIDSEVYGEFLVGCAGGINTKVDFNIEKKAFEGQAVEIEVDGLLGGHSGIEINKQRANANKILGRVLNEIRKNVTFNIISISGGSKHNAIPRKSNVVLAIKNTDDINVIKNIINECLITFKEEYRNTDPNLSIKFDRIQNTDINDEFSDSLTKNIINFLVSVPDGVQNISTDINGLVQTSLNIAVIDMKTDNIEIIISIRSSLGSLKHEIFEKLNIIAQLCEAKCIKVSEYPEWQYQADSDLRSICINTFKDLFKEEPKINLIHAGLECGLFKESMKDTDMISFGPDIMDAHTPTEHMNLETAKKCWEFTLKVLENLK